MQGIFWLIKERAEAEGTGERRAMALMQVTQYIPKISEDFETERGPVRQCPISVTKKIKIIFPYIPQTGFTPNCLRVTKMSLL